MTTAVIQLERLSRRFGELVAVDELSFAVERGAIFGLLGALVYYGRRSGQSAVGRSAFGYAAFLFIFGLIVPGVDNWAHLAGYFGGYFMACWLDPLSPERLDHIIVGLASLAHDHSTTWYGASARTWDSCRWCCGHAASSTS